MTSLHRLATHVLPRLVLVSLLCQLLAPGPYVPAVAAAPSPQGPVQSDPDLPPGATLPPPEGTLQATVLSVAKLGET